MLNNKLNDKTKMNVFCFVEQKIEAFEIILYKNEMNLPISKMVASI